MSSYITASMNEELRRSAHDSAITAKHIMEENTHWFIFPFVLYTGFIPSTETGWKPNNARPSDYSHYERIFTGDESIICQWQNSTRIYQKGKGTQHKLETEEDFAGQPPESGVIANDAVFFAIKHNDSFNVGYWQINDGSIVYDTKEMVEFTKLYTLTYFTPDGNQDQFYTKEYQTGFYWDAYLVNDTSGIAFDNLQSETIFKTQSTERTYTLYVTDIKATQMTINDYFNFSVVFNDNGVNIGGGTQNAYPQDRQWLYPSEVINYYSPWNGEFLFQQLTFSSVNDKLQGTGLDVASFIHTSAPGEGYCFPKITRENNFVPAVVDYDRVLIKDPGVKFFTFRMFGMGGLGALPFVGRPIIPNEFNEKIYVSRFLLISDIYSATPNRIQTYSDPDTTWFNVLGVQPAIQTYYDNWKKDMESRYNFLERKNFEGILYTDSVNTKATNGTAKGIKVKDSLDTKMYWAKNWEYEQPSSLSVSEGDVPNVLSVSTSRYFRYMRDDGLPIGNTDFNYSDSLGNKCIDYLNHNAFTFNQFTVLPLNLTQKLVFSPFTIPGGVGKFLNIISFGIPWGFVLDQDESNWPNFQFLNLFMPSTIYNFYNDTFWSDDAKGKGLLPLEFFREGGNDEVGGIIGANASSLAFTGKLTDKVKSIPLIIEDSADFPSSMVMSTYLLGQNFKPGINGSEYTFLWRTESTAVDCDTKINFDSYDKQQYNPLQSDKGVAYIIDMFSLFALFKGQIQIDFYSDNPFGVDERYQDKVSVWQWRGNTNSVRTNSLRNWVTNYKTSFLIPHEFEQPTFDYPKYILPPTPLNFENIELGIISPATPLFGDFPIVTSKIGFCSEDGQIFNRQQNTMIIEIKYDLKKYNQYLTSRELLPIIYDEINITGLKDLSVFIEEFLFRDTVDAQSASVGIMQGNNSCSEKYIGNWSDMQLYNSDKGKESKLIMDNSFTISANELLSGYSIPFNYENIFNVSSSYTLKGNGDSMTISGGIIFDKDYPNSLDFSIDNNVVLHIKFVIHGIIDIKLSGRRYKGFENNRWIKINYKNGWSLINNGNNATIKLNAKK